jgi:DNA-binding protein YbaB
MSFQKAKDMYKLQKEAKKIKKELKNMHIEAEHKGVTVTVSAEQKVIDIQIAPDVPHGKIGEYIKEALNRAMAKAQVVASEKMQGVMGEMGLGGGGQG